MHDGAPLVVDLRGQAITSWPVLWEALRSTCGLPAWFGENLDAWWDTIETGGISDVLDAHNGLVVEIDEVGMFAPGNPEGGAFLEVTNRSRYAEAHAFP